jgi:hypothetical protein
MVARIRLGFACGARLGIHLPHDLAHLISFLESCETLATHVGHDTGRQ